MSEQLGFASWIRQPPTRPSTTSWPARPAAVAAGRTHVPLPAALRVLLQPGRLCQTRREAELATDDWLRVLREARALGSVQCGFSGGEPLVRDDLEILVAEAHSSGFYTNLITSGVGLNETRVAELEGAGLDHVQLSFQDSAHAKLNDFLSNTKTFDLKQASPH